MRRGESAWNKGLPTSDKTREKMGESRYRSHAFRETILLSPEDEHLRAYRWSKNKGYAARRRNEGPTWQYLHHLILPLKPGYFVDHINGNPLDNRRENLRYVTRLQNAQNRKINANNKSGYKGVTWHKLKRKWTANIRVEGKLRYLGDFLDPAEAAKVYEAAAVEAFGEFQRKL